MSDNLLVVITFLLAIIAFVVAWVLRRAAARRDEDLEDGDDNESYTGGPPLDPKVLNERLDTIDLDLEHPPTDEREPHLPPRV
jgi:pilus assembly protein FimV